MCVVLAAPLVNFGQNFDEARGENTALLELNKARDARKACIVNDDAAGAKQRLGELHHEGTDHAAVRK
jgi:hypothetical protein